MTQPLHGVRLKHVCRSNNDTLFVGVLLVSYTDPVACLSCMQGAFVLLGTTGASVDIVILLVMMVALCAYITWRFWEGLAGQGYDET